jgi:hypothetical protein
MNWIFGLLFYSPQFALKRSLEELQLKNEGAKLRKKALRELDKISKPKYEPKYKTNG